MWNEYVKRQLQLRNQITRLTREQQAVILKLYADSIASLSKKAAKAGDKTLTRRWALDYQKALEKEVIRLNVKLDGQMKLAISKTGELVVDVHAEMMKKVSDKAGAKMGEQFTAMLSRVPKAAAADIIGGGIYYDNKTLSRRIWDATRKYRGDIQYIVAQGLIEKKSALELARDLEKFVEDPAKRPWSWGKVYPRMRNVKVDYNAQRLARTSINHAYQTATIQSAELNPFIEQIKWLSANRHERTCDICADRHNKLFPVSEVPLDHPNGLCTMVSVLTQDLNAIADELNRWLRGGEDPRLDQWYSEYGDYFATGDKKYLHKGILS